MKNSIKRLCRLHLTLGAAIILAGAFSTFAQKPYSIAEIQGDKNVSPHDNESVQIGGVVTAVLWWPRVSPPWRAMPGVRWRSSAS